MLIFLGLIWGGVGKETIFNNKLTSQPCDNYSLEIQQQKIQCLKVPKLKQRETKSIRKKDKYEVQQAKKKKKKQVPCQLLLQNKTG